MKKYLLFISALLFLCSFSNLAEAQRTETLFSGNVDHGGFGSLIYGVTSINGQAAYLKGSRGAWVIRFDGGNAIHLGFGSYRTSTRFDTVDWGISDTPAPEMSSNYGGFEIEYVNRSYKLIHFGIQSTIGSGSVKYRTNTDLDKNSDNYFVVQPGANLHLNVTDWFRISGGVFYRVASNVNLEGTSSSDLSGLTGIIGLRFGWF